MIALVNTKTQTVLREFNVDREAVVRVDLPDGSQVSPVTLGWQSGDFAVWTFVPFELPKGKQIVGEATDSFDAGSKTVTRSYSVEDIPTVIPAEISRRQFKMQIEIAGLADQVEAWVATQDRLVQIAYAESGSFVRSEPMMQSGFAALNVTDAEIDAFFLAAGQL